MIDDIRAEPELKYRQRRNHTQESSHTRRGRHMRHATCDMRHAIHNHNASRTVQVRNLSVSADRYREARSAVRGSLRCCVSDRVCTPGSLLPPDPPAASVCLAGVLETRADGGLNKCSRTAVQMRLLAEGTGALGRIVYFSQPFLEGYSSIVASAVTVGVVACAVAVALARFARRRRAARDPPCSIELDSRYHN